MIGTQMNSRREMLDDTKARLPFVTLITLAVWLALLTAFGFLLKLSPGGPLDQRPIEARLIDLPMQGLAGGGGGSPAGTLKGATQPAATRQPKRAEGRSSALPPRRETPDRPRLHKFDLTSASASPHQIAEVHPSEMLYSPERSTKTVRDNADSSASVKGTGAAGTMGVGHGTGSGSGHGIGSGAGAGGGRGFGTGGSGPRPIYAPVPSIPDEMRDEVMQATAIARFHVGRDGSATVTLVTPTEFSALDELILETLRRWRFQPALRNGAAIDSDAEVRLLITVQ
jgi:periplasmic protein TonB